jgi:zinc transport system ATP-binding protein
VKEVVLSGLISGKNMFRRISPDDHRKAEAIIEKNGLREFAGTAIGELSGGQMQRVFLSRAMVSSPQLLILDEPDTFVDNRFEHELYTTLKELNEEIAILLVSHDVGTISTYVKTIACVNKTLHYHPSNEISAEQLKVYNCPIDIITHGTVPHRVLPKHKK